MSVLEAVGRPMEVLLVEDSLVSARITIGALRKGKVQHRMTWLTDGNDALDFIYQRKRFCRAPRPDLILLDLNLPRLSGREVLEEVKQDANLKHIPVVVLTSSQAQEDVMRSYQLHANCFITKPVDLDQLNTVVQGIERFWFTLVTLPPEA